MVERYAAMVRDYPVWSIEDGLAEGDWDGWADLTARLGDDLRVGHEEVVAHDLGGRAEAGGQVGPAVPVALGQAVLDRPDRVVADHRRVPLDHVARGQRLAGDVVGPVAVELTGCRVKSDRDPGDPGGVARSLDGLHQQGEDVLGSGDVRGEAALVAQSGVHAAVAQQAAELAVDRRSGAHGLGEGRCTQWRDHELLEVQRVRGVSAAVEDVEAVSYTHLRAHETRHDLVCRLL